MQPILNNVSTLNSHKVPAARPNLQRKTSAEIISEAKSMLAGGGVRLVSTRRPITPREPRRQLYGKLAPPGRPPSAFSLRYLQFESRALPAIEPIQTQQSGTTVVDKVPFARSGSVGTLLDHEDNSGRSHGNKLPALLVPPSQITGSLDDLSEGMPPRKEFRYTKELSTKEQSTIDKTQKNENLKNNQRKSFDDGEYNKKTLPKTSKLPRNNDLLAQSSTEILLDMLKANAGIKECSEETASHINGILTELYTRVKGARGEWRGAVLGALYGLVECSSPKILLSVARVVLVLRVTGSNLTGACKLVFKIARNEVNDSLFVDSDVPELLIDGLGRANPLDEPEACIYGYGAVRFLANAIVTVRRDSKKPNSDSAKKKQRSIAQRLARHGAIQLMVLHLQIFNETGATKKLTGPPLHALFQLSGALRALAKTPNLSISGCNTPPSLFSNENNNCPQIQESFEEQDFELDLACLHLVRAAEICMDENEVQANVIRTISVLSENPTCCEVLSEAVGRIGVLLGPCGTTNIPEKQLSVYVRLGYILGNIMARHDAARLQFYNNDVALEYLINTLVFYSNKPLSFTSQNGDTIVDVLVKLVRVIANMSVNDEVGHGLGGKQHLGSVLLSLLLTVNNSKKKLSGDLEELLLAVLGALHNLSFYQNIAQEETGQYKSSLIERLADISAALCTTLTNSPESAQSEAARVLGNMTRSPVARNTLCSAGGLKVLVKNLESEDEELLATTCGVLVNLLGDWERRAPFRELKGPLFIRDVLQRAALQQNWILAGIACQALWNYLMDTANVVVALGEDEADYIVGDLAEYLDEERLFNGGQPDQMWEQFAIVATDLLERIQSCVTYSNSPCASSSEEDVAAGRIGNTWPGQFKSWLQENN